MNSDDTNPDRTDDPDHDFPFIVDYEDDVMAAGYTSIPNVILEAGLSSHAKVLWLLLNQHGWKTGDSYPGQSRLASRLGVKPRSVRTYLRELEHAKLLLTRRGGYQKPNRYTLLRPDRQYLAALTDRQNIAAEEGTGSQLHLTPSNSAPQGRAHASAHAHTGGGAIAPDPKPPSAQPVVAAWITARRAAGKGDPPRQLTGQVSSTVKRLLRDGVPLEAVTEAAERYARSSYGPGIIAQYADDVVNGITERQPRRTVAEALADSPFIPGRADEHA